MTTLPPTICRPGATRAGGARLAPRRPGPGRIVVARPVTRGPTPPEARQVLAVAAFPDASATLRDWLRSQAVNGARGALLIRPFHAGDVGNGAAAPSAAQLRAVNELLDRVRGVVTGSGRQLGLAAGCAAAEPNTSNLMEVCRRKSEATTIVGEAERVWHFYWEVFSQRQTFVAPLLLAADRIALDCYQWTWQGLGAARSVPSPPPFTFLESGIGPATYRRGVTMARIGRLPNPFPLVKLPYHRMATPWTLGALPHEIGHNLQADLDLWLAVPRRLLERLRALGVPRPLRLVWARWTKEIWADLFGVLAIGPAYVGSLMDVVGRSAAETTAFHPRGAHPIPWLRVLINTHLLARIGFAAEASAYNRAWLRLYPASVVRAIPPEIRGSFARCVRATVEAIAFTAYPQLGGRTLTQVIAFRRQDQATAEEAARRLAAGIDPGIVPERFLIAAARIAFDRRLAPPSTIARHFYDALGRR